MKVVEADQQKMNRSRAAILKQAADAVREAEGVEGEGEGGGRERARTEERSAAQMCEENQPRVRAARASRTRSFRSENSASTRSTSSFRASPSVCARARVCTCMRSAETDTVPKMACSWTAPLWSRGLLV